MYEQIQELQEQAQKQYPKSQGYMYETDYRTGEVTVWKGGHKVDTFTVNQPQ